MQGFAKAVFEQLMALVNVFSQGMLRCPSPIFKAPALPQQLYIYILVEDF